MWVEWLRVSVGVLTLMIAVAQYFRKSGQPPAPRPPRRASLCFLRLCAIKFLWFEFIDREKP